jgi:hypothetical protein
MKTTKKKEFNQRVALRKKIRCGLQKKKAIIQSGFRLASSSRRCLLLSFFWNKKNSLITVHGQPVPDRPFFGCNLANFRIASGYKKAQGTRVVTVFFFPCFMPLFGGLSLSRGLISPHSRPYSLFSFPS